LTPRLDCLGRYGEQFGIPELNTRLSGNRIETVSVLRGAPCGATWKAVESIIGMKAKDATKRYGLEIQFLCSANATLQDPIAQKNPIHSAAQIHCKALERSFS